jgi:hypothetical protein
MLSRDQVRAFRSLREAINSAPPGAAASWLCVVLMDLDLPVEDYRSASRALDRHADELERIAGGES